MNNKAKKIIKHLSYTVFSNFISITISGFVVLVIPKLLGIEAYGYWQLYTFYASYVGFFQFGINDGIYLRYGGRRYEELDKQNFFSQFWILVLSQFFLACLIIFFSYTNTNPDKQFIWCMVSICMIIMGTRAMLLFILQATNRIKEYATITIIDRLCYFLLLIGILLIGVRAYKIIIFADIIGKFTSLVISAIYCKDIVFNRVQNFKINFKEICNNINVGIKLMFANIASMLINGVVRFGIEQKWDISTFGKVSLTLNISNLLMQFINAVGIILYPILRRTDEKKLSSIYIVLRDFLMIGLMGILNVYYPLKIILIKWLPDYSDSLMYMALIFPMCVYEGKMALLINTYFKTLRKEQSLLLVNLITVVISILSTTILTVFIGNLNLVIVSIVMLLLFRSTLSEIILSKCLGILLVKDLLLEIILTLGFIFGGWFINSWCAFAIYLVLYIIYILIKKADIINSYIQIRNGFIE